MHEFNECITYNIKIVNELKDKYRYIFSKMKMLQRYRDGYMI